MGSVMFMGVTPTAAAVALLIGKTPGVKVRVLAERMGVQPATMRQHVRLLELSGIVAREGRALTLAVPLADLQARWGVYV